MASPNLGVAPGEYSAGWMAGFIRNLTAQFAKIDNPGSVLCTTLQATALPLQGSDLPDGSLWDNNGVVNVVSARYAYAPSFSATFAVGQVT